jgi:hypothetical protein
MSNIDGAPAPGGNAPSATPGAPPAGGAPPAAGSVPGQQQTQPPSGRQPPAQTGGQPASLAQEDIGGLHPDGGQDQTYWPQDWRDRLIGNKPERKNWLDRYATPEALIDKLENQEKVIRQRPAAPPPKPPDTATAEEKAAWYQQVGLPATPDGYAEVLTLSDGKVLGEADMPVAQHFFDRMHQVGAPKEVVSAAVDSMLEYVEEQQSQQIVEDRQFQQQSRDQLRDEFGAEYKRNMSFIRPAFGGNNDLMSMVLSSRGPDGRLLGDRVDMIQWLVGVGRGLDPEATMGGDGNTSLQTLENEIETIRALSAKQDSEYWHGPKAEKMQARYGQLLEQRDRIKARMEARTSR